MRHHRLDTRLGRCTIVELAEGDELEQAIAALPEAERALARARSEVTRRDFVAGRTALHLALEDLVAATRPSPGRGEPFAPAIARTHRGAPAMPAGLTGSVSHKAGTAIGIVAPAPGWIGIDLEWARPPTTDIGKRILTAAEQRALPADPRAVTLRFAIKEAIYKAVDPIVERYVGFQEVELEVAGDGGCTVVSQLPAAIEAAWCEHAGYWIATARAVRRG